MFQLKKLYRKDYTGEEILVNTTYRNATWEYDYENVPNRVTNIQLSGKACVIGNGESRAKFDLSLLASSQDRGSQRSLQTYGCNALYRDFHPNFLVSTGDDVCLELSNTQYWSSHIVYANAKNLLRFPSLFYLVPQDVPWNAGSIATYLACFDGHKQVYLLGFDNGAGANYNNNMYAGTNGYPPRDFNYNDLFFVKTMEQIMRVYNDVEFIRVMPNARWSQPLEWTALPNYRQVDFRTMGVLCDL